ncbi:hypothetical protein DRO30_03015, partial [Candidatus Bathyarchaeota archaeon]
KNSYMVRKIFIFLLTILLLAPVASAKVVCTTTVLASIVEDLSGEKCEVIASPTVCPGHYDIRPSDIEKVKDANVIFAHGFEPWVDELVNASKSEARVVKVPGPWNTPKTLKDKYIKIAGELEKLGYEVNLEKCLNSINKTESYLKTFAANNGFVNTSVICMQWQKGFIEFLGFKILATYPPPEMISAKKYEEIIQKGKDAKLVIDNLQSGTELGEKIAKEIGAVEVALSNFPMEGNVTTMMIQNAEKLANALKTTEEVKVSPGFELLLTCLALAMLVLSRIRK